MDQDRPIVRIKTGDQHKRIPGRADKRARPKLTPEVQARRLGPAVTSRLTEAIEGRIDVARDPRGLATERALVLEIVGEVVDFAKLAAKVGLDWLAEEIIRVELDADLQPVFGKPVEEQESEFSDDDEDATLQAFLNESMELPTASGRLYLGMPTVETFKKLKKLWNRYQRGDSFPKGFSDWWQLFGRLKDLRGWGPLDRISEDTRQMLNGLIEENPSAHVKVEVDLWSRGKEADRAEAFEAFTLHLNEVSGKLLDSAEIGDVRYHAALISLPASQVKKLTELSGALAFADEIMSIVPQSILFAKPGHDDTASSSARRPIPAKADSRPPILALLDGYPVDEHDLLKNRISIEEVDVVAKHAPLDRRRHGTAMASLILHGDLAAGEAPLSRTLKVVPVLAPTQGGHESTPTDKLPLAMIYRAVNRLKGGNGRKGVSPEVLIINHSLGADNVQFANSMSPWARMLDYLAYAKKVLFVVSAGNILEEFDVAAFTDIPSFRAARPADRQRHIVLGLDAAKSSRSMRVPAEHINGLTVAAIHADASREALPPTAVDPYQIPLPNLWSGMGLGFNRSVKPDIATAGGRLTAQPQAGRPLTVHGHMVGQLGQMTACPDLHGASTNKQSRSVGTSNATAITTRAAAQIADALDIAFRGEEIYWRDRPTAAVMVKALVAHGARWGRAGRYLDGHLPPQGSDQWSARRENIARHIGYGEIDSALVMNGSTHRITLLGEGEIRVNKRHPYFVPLPRELSARADVRKIIMTLAWMSPIRPGSQNYRMVGLDIVDDNGSRDFWSGVKRVASIQPPEYLGRKGTLIHSVYEGDQPEPIVAGAGITFNVQASSRLTGVSKMDIPYALAITIEVASSLDADIYQSVRQRLRAGVRR